MDNEYENEEWRDIEGFPGYQVSNLGRARSSRKGAWRLMTTNLPSYGYINICMKRDRKSHSIPLHKLVALTFLGQRPDGCQIHHKDHDKANNRLDNLVYLTIAEHSAEDAKYRRNKERKKQYDEYMRTLGYIPSWAQKFVFGED